MSAIDNPTFGLYGTWEADNADCVAKGLEVSSDTRMVVLLFASVCFCQVLFMASRAPRVAWEAVYLPFVEAVLYGLAASGNGQMRLADGRMVPIARFCSWLITCPIMLFQVVGIHDVKYWGVSSRNLVMAAALIRTVFGIGASVSTDNTTRWVQYGLAFIFFLFEMVTVHQIYQEGLKKFGAFNSKINNIVTVRLLFLRTLFFVSWNSFPIIWLLSSTGLCAISENSSVLAYLVADMICKNLYGIVNTNTLFRVLDGAWEPETEEDPQDRTKDFGATYLEMLLSRMRGGDLHNEDEVYNHVDHGTRSTVTDSHDERERERSSASLAKEAVRWDSNSQLYPGQGPAVSVSGSPMPVDLGSLEAARAIMKAHEMTIFADSHAPNRDSVHAAAAGLPLAGSFRALAPRRVEPQNSSSPLAGYHQNLHYCQSDSDGRVPCSPGPVTAVPVASGLRSPRRNPVEYNDRDRDDGPADHWPLRDNPLWQTGPTAGGDRLSLSPRRVPKLNLAHEAEEERASVSRDWRGSTKLSSDDHDGPEGQRASRKASSVSSIGMATHSPVNPRRVSNRDLQITEEFMDLARRISSMAGPGSDQVEQPTGSASARGGGQSPTRDPRADAFGPSASFGQSHRSMSVESPRQSRRRRKSIEARTGTVHTSEYFLGPREY